MRDSIYGFEGGPNPPLSALHVHMIPSVMPEWAMMDDFKDLAKNHCAATSLLNALRLAENFRIPLSGEKERFAQIHKYVKNGPVFHIAPGANRYLQKVHSPWRVERIQKSVLCAALRDRCPVFLLVRGAFLHWHWIVAAGFYDDKNGARHLLIEDNWHRQDFESIPLSKLKGRYFRAAYCLVRR